MKSEKLQTDQKLVNESPNLKLTAPIKTKDPGDFILLDTTSGKETIAIGLYEQGNLYLGQSELPSKIGLQQASQAAISHSKRYLIEVGIIDQASVLSTHFLEYSMVGVQSLYVKEATVQSPAEDIRDVHSFKLVSLNEVSPGPEKYPINGAFNILVYFGISGTLNFAVDFVSSSFAQGYQIHRNPIQYDKNLVPEHLRNKTPEEFFCFDLKQLLHEWDQDGVFSMKCVFILDKKNLGEKITVFSIGFKLDRELTTDQMALTQFSEQYSIPIIQNFSANRIELSSDRVLMIQGCIGQVKSVVTETDAKECGFQSFLLSNNPQELIKSSSLQLLNSLLDQNVSIPTNQFSPEVLVIFGEPDPITGELPESKTRLINLHMYGQSKTTLKRAILNTFEYQDLWFKIEYPWVDLFKSSKLVFSGYESSTNVALKFSDYFTYDGLMVGNWLNVIIPSSL